MAYAIIKTGGKQYKVSPGDLLNVELIDGAKTSSETTFDQILLRADDSGVVIGTPTVAGAKVIAEVIGEVRADKVTAFKYRRRKGYHRTIGHRQRLTRVKIKEIAA